jgi:hypothetical protein
MSLSKFVKTSKTPDSIDQKDLVRTLILFSKGSWMRVDASHCKIEAECIRVTIKKDPNYFVAIRLEDIEEIRYEVHYKEEYGSNKITMNNGSVMIPWCLDYCDDCITDRSKCIYCTRSNIQKIVKT